MEELIAVEQIERALTILAIVLPSGGILIGAIVGAARGSFVRQVIAGLLFGLFGPAIWLLWRMYNGIVGAFGLDSVRGLLINLALFVAIGLVTGLAAAVLWRRLFGPAQAG